MSAARLQQHADTSAARKETPLSSFLSRLIWKCLLPLLLLAT
jgi:hypothetical protein